MGTGNSMFYGALLLTGANLLLRLAGMGFQVYLTDAVLVHPLCTGHYEERRNLRHYAEESGRWRWV